MKRSSKKGIWSRRLAVVERPDRESDEESRLAEPSFSQVFPAAEIFAAVRLLTNASNATNNVGNWSDQLLRFSSTKADWLRLMRVSVRRISLWALLTYAVLAVFGQPLHQWTYHARPLAVVAPGGSCCPCAPPGPGGAATDTSATSQSNDDSPARQHPPHDSQHCVVCQFSIKAQALPEVFDCPVWQSLIERLTLPEPPVLAPEFHAAFFSRGPPPA